jgi:TPP-dependent pyruvate/acetoin dehydrogenase alpha subunit
MIDHGLTKEDMIKFEEQIAQDFKEKKIRTIIHLYSGGEEEMLKIFEDVEPEDWVCCSWRSHYQCLLKGVPKDELRNEILAGHSIALCFPDYRIVSSGIVGGIVPIALGIAAGIALRGGRERVHCWMGDMTSETGVAHEAVKFAEGHDLPIEFYVEDNSVSVCTDTKSVWGMNCLTFETEHHPKVHFYKYEMKKYPHAGAGERIQF